VRALARRLLAVSQQGKVLVGAHGPGGFLEPLDDALGQGRRVAKIAHLAGKRVPLDDRLLVEGHNGLPGVYRNDAVGAVDGLERVSVSRHGAGHAQRRK
jgi:hypothetical protein